jgi:hypothetical protein
MKKYFLLSAAILALLLNSAQAACLHDCESAPAGLNFPEVIAHDSFDREDSHNLDNVKNSIVGDIYIRNGHEQVTIKNVRSKQVGIDTSIHNTIILGDLQK